MPKEPPVRLTYPPVALAHGSYPEVAAYRIRFWLFPRYIRVPPFPAFERGAVTCQLHTLYLHL